MANCPGSLTKSVFSNWLSNKYSFKNSCDTTCPGDKLMASFSKWEPAGMPSSKALGYVTNTIPSCLALVLKTACNAIARCT